MVFVPVVRISCQVVGPTWRSSRNWVSLLELSVQLSWISVGERARAHRPEGAAGGLGRVGSGGGGGGGGVPAVWASRPTAVWRRVRSCPMSLPRGAFSRWVSLI